MKNKILKAIGILVTVISFPVGANTAQLAIYPIINKTSLSFEEYSCLEAAWILWIALIGIMLVILSNQKD